MVHVAHRGMLEAVRDGKQPLPRKVLRGLQCSSIREYATTIASSINGNFSLNESLICIPLCYQREPLKRIW